MSTPTIDLTTDTAGIKSPNPFWLASAPPTNMGSMVARAFEAGWGGAVWKTIGDPIINVSSRLAGLDYRANKLIGLNNVELITDRSPEINFREISEVKKRFPKHAVIASLMVESKRETWHEIVKRTNDSGADGIELNFGCPHGMSERGMGSAMGQVPEYACMVTEWVKEIAKVPVLVKLTPNVASILPPGRAAVRGGADGLSLINTINSVMGVDVDTWLPMPLINGKAAHGGYCGPAVKPIALNMVGELARDKEIKVPISGIGGIETWRDAVEFILLGSTSVQVCTAVMHYGFRIVEDLIDGLTQYLIEKKLSSPKELIGKAVHTVTDWSSLDLNYKVLARVDKEKCIQCNLCFVACEDGAHQAIALRPDAARNGKVYPEIIDEECVGCNLCSLVCPSPGAINMVRMDGNTESLSWREAQDKGIKIKVGHGAKNIERA
jgi:dihydropyrimidine dehydrogenase (NAD+) subunit PreA